MTAVVRAVDSRHTYCSTAAVHAADGRRTMTFTPYRPELRQLILLPVNHNI
ncbi:MAG: hypothetical protein HXL35_04655 [Prevotellaceae bacterium]|nr:hypothetical protein [Prevotellaceae bacterium]